jgi:hypothetical protein
VKIAELEMNLNDHAILGYMKYQNTTSMGQTRTLEEVRVKTSLIEIILEA